MCRTNEEEHPRAPGASGLTGQTPVASFILGGSIVLPYRQIFRGLAEPMSGPTSKPPSVPASERLIPV